MFIDFFSSNRIQFLVRHIYQLATRLHSALRRLGMVMHPSSGQWDVSRKGLSEISFFKRGSLCFPPLSLLCCLEPVSDAWISSSHGGRQGHSLMMSELEEAFFDNDWQSCHNQDMDRLNQDLLCMTVLNLVCLSHYFLDLCSMQLNKILTQSTKGI